MNDNELNPCPFCGKALALLGEPAGPDEYGVFCNNCGATGPMDADGEYAMVLWNVRPTEDALRRTLSNLVAERQDVVRLLREICAEYGDNDWPDNLHLYDVIEKHLWRHLDPGEDGER